MGVFVIAGLIALIPNAMAVDLHWVTMQGVDPAITFPGFDVFPENTYVSFVVKFGSSPDEGDLICLSLQIGSNSPKHFVTGETIPSDWMFPRSRGHTMIAEKCGLGTSDIRSSAKILGGGILITHDSSTPNRMLILETKTRSVQGVGQIGLMLGTASQGEVADRAQHRNDPFRDNGRMGLLDAKRVGLLLARELDVPLHYFTIERKKGDSMQSWDIYSRTLAEFGGTTGHVIFRPIGDCQRILTGH